MSGSGEGWWLNSPYASSSTTREGFAACAASYRRRTVAGSTAVPVGLLGVQMKKHVGPVLGDGGDSRVDVDGEVVAARAGEPAGAGAARDQRVHGVGGLEAEGGAAGAAEGLQQLLEDLVGAVGGPDVRLGDLVARGTGEVGGEFGAQLHRVPVGVAVEVPGGLGDALGDAGDEGLGQRVGVLVGVQPDGHVELGGAVRGLAAQFVPDGEVVDAGHVLTEPSSHCDFWVRLRQNAP
ncbi:hypothetical protein GCM10020000_60250 [Streptomyces olivoverticillatus]